MLDRSTVDEFAASLRGPLLEPGAPAYDAARRVWNGMIDRRPALIACCTGAADVRRAVNFARQRGLRVSIKGGGHSVAGKSVCEGGLMIDLSPMKGVTVDPRARTARVGPGATLGDLDDETQAFGLATPAGLVSKTGVAGLTLGGGIGYLARRFGLTLDNLISADVVTANGEWMRASDRLNPDLFWGLRGGGGNFGIVTSFEFRLHKVGPEVLTAQVFYPIAEAPRVLRLYRELMAEAPDELACYALALNLPPEAPWPEKFWGKASIALVACYSKGIAKGRRLLARLKELGKPIFGGVQPMPYVALQRSFDAGMPDGMRYYWKACNFREISDAAIETFQRHANPIKGSLSIVGFEPMGGAIRRVDPAATAFADREAAFALGIWSGWTDAGEDDEVIAWTRQFHNAMAPHSTGGVYSNYLGEDDDGRVKAAFGDNYERLQDVKARYDPDNFFRLNPNVEPGA